MLDVAVMLDIRGIIYEIENGLEKAKHFLNELWFVNARFCDSE